MNLPRGENKYLKKWVPYMWPWAHPLNDRYTFWSWINSRKFSIFYLVTIWLVLALLGFAERRDCDTGPWQMVLQCNWSMWMAEYKTNFWHFMATSFTTPWLHNDFVHILFVTIFGFIFPVQSFEAQHGTRLTVFIYFFSYILIAIFNGALFNTLIEYWPEETLFSHAFSRAWMGGSVGIFALMGGLSFFSCKKWFIYSLVFVFELFNYFILGNNIYISFIHITSTSFGWIICFAREKLRGSRWVFGRDSLRSAS